MIAYLFWQGGGVYNCKLYKWTRWGKICHSCSCLATKVGTTEPTAWLSCQNIAAYRRWSHSPEHQELNPGGEPPTWGSYQLSYTWFSGYNSNSVVSIFLDNIWKSPVKLFLEKFISSFDWWIAEALFIIDVISPFNSCIKKVTLLCCVFAFFHPFFFENWFILYNSWCTLLMTILTLFFPAACHCVALDAEGRCYTWGRNEV
jgi:hypothetical protein